MSPNVERARTESAPTSVTDIIASVVPTSTASVRYRPLDASGVSLGAGFWGTRQTINRERTIPRGAEQLRKAGNLRNFALAAGADGSYRAEVGDAGLVYPFVDSDVYKWLEAVGWELRRAPDASLSRLADEMIGLVANAQLDDGYVNTFVQVGAPGREFADLAWGHELYTIGHLVQAGIAWQRALGDSRLMAIARRAVDRVDAELGAEGRAGVDGHPEIEMALIELYRTVGDERHLSLARRFIEERGHGLLGDDRFGAAYWQDHAPVRDAPTVAGHAVRQMYLDCGAVDLAVETGDSELLEAVIHRWNDMVATRTHLTGAIGSRHRDESFGDPYELPPDQAYAETCAAIGSVMLAWRLLLATGEERFADHLERTLYNAVLPGVSLDGQEFFYVNPLQRRRQYLPSGGPDVATRQPWFACACCPPNLMRLLASVEHYLATVDHTGIQIHMLATCTLRFGAPGEETVLDVATDYPWDGAVRIQVVRTPERPWRLRIRRPAWAASGQARLADQELVWPSEPYIDLDRRWRSGDVLELTFDMPPHYVTADPRIDAIRGCGALERGPLVYCLEEADLPAGVTLDEVVVLRDRPLAVEPGPLPLAPALAIRARVATFTRPFSAWPYYVPGAESTPSSTSELDVIAIPYFAWANRGLGGMRVWTPETAASIAPRQSDQT